MKLTRHHLRIAVSVFFGLLTVALVRAVGAELYDF